MTGPARFFRNRPAPPRGLFLRETARPDRLSDNPPERPPKIEHVLLAMFVAGFLSGGALVAFICRLTILNGAAS